MAALFKSRRSSTVSRTDAEKIAEERHETQVSRLYILIAGGREQFVRLATPVSALPKGLIVASSIMAD